MKTLVIVLLFLVLCSPRTRVRADARGHTFDSNGVAIYYTIAGMGEPVVLIHGLHASADLNWLQPGIITTLATRYQVIALDLRGHGRSGRPAHQEAYGLHMVGDIIRLLEHLKIARAHIVGYSMGGMIALKLMTQHPERVRSGTLGGMGWLRQGSALQHFWARLPVRQGARTPTACVHSLAALAVTAEEVKAVRVPTAILVGDRDPVRQFYVAPLQRVRHDWPVVLIAHAGHLTAIGTRQFSAELRHWLDRNAGH